MGGLDSVTAQSGDEKVCMLERFEHTTALRLESDFCIAWLDGLAFGVVFLLANHGILVRMMEWLDREIWFVVMSNANVRYE
jgi:hypothetical protein